MHSCPDRIVPRYLSIWLNGASVLDHAATEVVPVGVSGPAGARRRLQERFSCKRR
jgi:hypothetical protein